MVECFKCHKVLPGNLRPGEYVMCKECEEWFNPDNLKIKVPKLDEETIKNLSQKVEKKKVLQDERL